MEQLNHNFIVICLVFSVAGSIIIFLLWVLAQMLSDYPDEEIYTNQPVRHNTRPSRQKERPTAATDR